MMHENGAGMGKLLKTDVIKTHMKMKHSNTVTLNTNLIKVSQSLVRFLFSIVAPHYFE